MTMNNPTPQQLLDDPCSSFWLKQSLAAALQRDPVDAVNDAEALAGVLRARADAVLGTPSSVSTQGE